MSSRTYFQRIDFWSIFAILIPFAVYLRTLAPSVTFFDSGEFITAIYSLGSAHSPGYPTFINYAKPFTYLPFGSIAFRVNIATAFSSALACYAVYLLVLQLLRDEIVPDDTRFTDFFKKMAALSAALSFAFTARLWLQSNHDKPYPLVAFLTAIAFYLLLLWRDQYRRGEERPAYIYLASFLAGIAFGAHQTVVLLLPAYAFLILSVEWRLITRVKEFILAVAFALLGFSVHLHLVIRATRNPLLNWADPQSLSQFLWHLLRKGYPVEKPVRDVHLLWAQINAFNIPHEFTNAGLLLLALGLVVSLKKRRDEVLAYGIALLSFLLVIVGFFNTPLELIFLTEEFFTPLYLLSAVLIGVGLFYLLQKVTSAAGKVMHSAPAQLLAAAALLALPVTVGSLHYLENDQHENYIAYDYAGNSLRSLPQGAVLYTWGDSGAFPLWYLQGVERMRDDLDILHTPHLVFKWYLDAFPDLFSRSVLRTVADQMLAPEQMLQLSIAEMIRYRPVFVDFSTRYSVPLDSYALIKRGITYRLQKNASWATASDGDIWPLYVSRGLRGDMFFRDLDTGKAILIYANAHMESGETLLRLNRVGEGIAEMQLAGSLAPDLHNQIDTTIRNYGIK